MLKIHKSLDKKKGNLSLFPNRKIGPMISISFKSLVLCFIFSFISTIALAQKDSINKQIDSSNAIIIQAYNKKIATIESQRINDSIKKVELQTLLLSLKTTDYLKRKELQEQLQVLSKKDSLRFAEKKKQIDILRKTAKGYAVKDSFNDTLFIIYNKLGSFSAKDRADAISNRIKNLYEQLSFNADSLKIVDNETSLDLFYKETIIISITENDAIWNNSTKLDLAKKYKSIINEAVIRHKNETSYKTLLKEIGLALLVLLITILIIYYLRKLFRWTATKIQLQENKLIKGIKINNFSLYNAKQQVNALLNINTIVEWFFLLLLIYIALPILFGIFPWTKGYAQILFGYILTPLQKIALGLWDYLPNLITILVIIFVFRYALKGIHFLKNEIEKGTLHVPGFYADWANPTYQIVRILIFAFMIVVIFPYLPGNNSNIFKGVSVFLGFLFTFASAGSISNIIAGLILTYMRLFKIGDRIKISDVTGVVIEKSLLVTRIRTNRNEIISIPNSTVMSSHTINYSMDAIDKGLIIFTKVTIGYDVPWKDVHDALLEAAKRTELILDDPKPFVLQTALEDFYVSYEIDAYIQEVNRQGIIYSDLHQNIQDCFNERGIEIMSPHYRAARDGNKTSIPENYLTKDYKAPVFNIKWQKEE